MMEDLAKVSIEKRGYSSHPWRLIDPDGQEMYQWEPYPGRDDLPPICMPACFDTKAEAIEALGAMVVRLTRRVDELEDDLARRDFDNRNRHLTTATPEDRLYRCESCGSEHTITRGNADPPLPWPNPDKWTCWSCPRA